MWTNSGRINSGFDQISPISYAAVSSCCSTSSSVIKGSRIVSANKATVVGTAELKVADWYMSDSLEEAHCIFPPKDSSASNISSLDRFVVDLKASLSIIWLTPLRYSFSYRDPASIYTPIPEKCPGRASVATRTPFGRVDISSSSAGSYISVSPVGRRRLNHRDLGEHTFCMGSTTVARLLDRNVGSTLAAIFFVEIARVRALEEEHFNMLVSSRLALSSINAVAASIFHVARLLP
jgi:hypothetical protein